MRLHKLPGSAFNVVFACGSMAPPNFAVFVFALCERKNENKKKAKYRSAEG
jgi:hypothetical protein